MASRAGLWIEALEDRACPAIFGTPWPDAQHLTLSFAPDGTAIAGQQSNLNQFLDTIEPAPVWQSEILRAVQAWSAYANINVGVVSDGGQPFGTAGSVQGDARFGDIRIGAEPMLGALANSVPPAPYLSGTWAGDILLNSSYAFDAPTSIDLYSVMLHEVGHVLGLRDSSNPQSVMYVRATTPHQGLSLGDISAVKALYGARVPDSHAGNGTIASASPIAFVPNPDAPLGSLPLIAYGDITRVGETDFFSVQAPGNYSGAMTFRLLTSGISLLQPSVTIVDASGAVYGSAQSTNLFGDVVSVQLPSVSPGQSYYIKVAGPASGSFNLGRYGLAVILDSRSTATTAAIDAVLRGPYESLPASKIDQLLRNPTGVLFGDDGLGNSTLATALALTTSPGYLPNSHYQLLGSLANAEDFSFFKVISFGSGTGTDVMTVSVNGIGPNGDAPNASVFDANGNPVAATVLVNGNGAFTIQASNLVRGAIYYLRLGNPDMASTGNFSLTVDFTQPTHLLAPYAHGTLSSTVPQKTNALFVAKNQIFQLALTARSSTGTSGSVEMIIADANNNVVLDLKARVGGDPNNATVLLAPGAYKITFKATYSEDARGPVIYGVQGSVLSDPIGPTPTDPTLQPIYTQPGNPNQYIYPNGTVTQTPYLWLGYPI